MFCPRCESEFRPGFTRCGACDVDLVDSLDAVQESAAEAPSMPSMPVAMAEVCGYLDFADARRERDLLHGEGILTELVVRVSPDCVPGDPIVEEYWLRAEAQQMKRVQALLEGQPAHAEPAQEEPPAGSFKCSNCGRPVREEESFCANCGMRFES